MLISEELTEAINRQIGNEFNSSMQYVAIASHFDSESLPQLAAHFYRQAEEERMHAMKFVRFLVEAGGAVKIPALPAPESSFPTAQEAVQKALDGEIKVTQQINELFEMATAQKDHITQTFLQWFLTEQLEEVSSTETLLSIVRRAGEQGLLFVEEYLVRNGDKLSNAPEATA